MGLPNYKLDFRNKSVPQKVAICERFIHGVANVPPENRVYVPLDSLQDELADVHAALAEVESLQFRLRAALARRDQAVARVCASVRHGASAYRCQAKTVGDLVGAGLELARHGVRGTIPAAPGKFRALPATHAGTVRLAWTREFRRCCFIVQITTEPAKADSWKLCDTFVTTRSTVTGLRSGVSYWFRVAARNSSGRSPWSKPLPVMAV